MARLRRDLEPERPPCLQRFRLPEWIDHDEPVPAEHLDDPGLWRGVSAFRRYQAAKRAWGAGT